MEYNPPTLGRGDTRSKSQSPIKTSLNASPEHFNSILGQLMKKDREIDAVMAENSKLKDQIREFEYLIVKASEEVKKKQAEITELKAVIDGLNKSSVDLSRVGELQNQLIDAKATIKSLEDKMDHTHMQLRLEVQKEKEINVSLNAKLQEAKAQQEKLMAEAKSTADQLQRSYNALSQRYSKLEQEHENAIAMTKDLESQNSAKDQAIDHAHMIIKKLKDEVDAVKAENESLQNKVKEYKSKCKTLKKNNLNHVEQIKELEKKAKENEHLRKELERAKEDVHSFIKMRIEDKGKEEITTELQRVIESLRAEITTLQNDNSILSRALSEEQLKTKEICSELVDKEETITQLTEKFKQEEAKWKAELEEFKTQALRSFQLLSPSKTTSTSQFHNVVRLSQDVTKTRSAGSLKNGQVRRGFIRSTPVGNARARSRSPGEAIQVHENLEVGREASPNTSKVLTDSVRIEKDESKRHELTIAFLQEELDKSLDREHYLTLLIESITAKAEAEMKKYADRLAELNKEPAEKPSDGIPEDPEKQYLETTKVISELTAQNRLLVAQLEKLTAEFNELKNNYESNAVYFLNENEKKDNLIQQMLNDSKSLFTAFENTENITLRDLKQSSDLIKMVTAEGEKYRDQVRALEDIIDSANLYPTLTNTAPLSFSASKEKKPVTKKLTSLIRNYQTKIDELEEEKNNLFEKFTKLEREYQSLKNVNSRMEKDYIDSLREKDEVIRTKDELIRKKDELISQREKASMSQADKVTELSSKEARIIALLNDKEEVIRGLLVEKEHMLASLDNLHETCNELRKQLKEREDEVFSIQRGYTERIKEYSEKCRELSIKQDRIVELQNEIISKGKLLDEKDQQLATKEILIMERDRRIVQLQNEIATLTEELAAYQNQPLPRKTDGSVIYGSIKKNLSLDKSPERDMPTYPSKHLTSQFLSPTMKSPSFQSEKFENAGLKEKIEELTRENRDLVKRLTHLNEIIIANRLDHHAQRIPTEVDKSRDDSYIEKHSKKSKSRTVTEQSAPLFDDSYIDYSMAFQDEKPEKDSSKNLKENIFKDKETAEYIEKYKAKIKKMFHKRVKELELILRYLDYKIRGFNFKKSGYAVPTPSYEYMAYDEAKIISKLETLVNNMLEKNSNLRTFLHSMTRNIDKLYLKQYNVTVTLAKLFKALFMNSVDSENYATLNQFGLLSDLEVLFELNIPNQTDSYDHIETISHIPPESRNDFFYIFERLESKLNFLNEFLLSTMKQASEIKHQYLSFRSNVKEFLTIKKEKYRDLEVLYQKLRNVLETSKQTNVQTMQENLKNYAKAFHNIFKALFNESAEVVNFIIRNTISSPEKTLAENNSSSALNPNISRNLTVTPWQPLQMNPRQSTSSSIQNLSVLGSTKDDSINLSRKKSPAPLDRKSLTPKGALQTQTLKAGMMPTTKAQESQKIMNDIITYIDNIERTANISNYAQTTKKRSTSQDNLNRGRSRSRTPSKK